MELGLSKAEFLQEDGLKPITAIEQNAEDDLAFIQAMQSELLDLISLAERYSKSGVLHVKREQIASFALMCEEAFEDLVANDMARIQEVFTGATLTPSNYRLEWLKSKALHQMRPVPTNPATTNGYTAFKCGDSVQFRED